MTWHDEFLRILKDEFSERSARNSRYSLRSFARHLGLSQGSVFRLFAGRLRFSQDRALEVIQKIGRHPIHAYRVRRKMEPSLPPLPEISWPSSGDEMLRSWLHIAVLTAHHCAFEDPVREMAKRFGVQEKDIERAFADLQRTGLLASEPRELGHETSRVFKAGDQKPSEVVRDHHRDALHLALRALAIPPEDRDFATMTFSASASQLAAFRAEVRALFERLMASAHDGSPHDEVMRVSVQLFPVNFATAKAPRDPPDEKFDSRLI